VDLVVEVDVAGIVRLVPEDEAAVPDVVVVVIVASVVLVSLDLRLDLDADLRIEGTSKDSLAFGSSSLVYRPNFGL
jgi:hypothetical protein